MSWDASLEDTDGHCFGMWNYTHNCNPMINSFLRESGNHNEMIERSARWWERRDRLDQAAKYRESRTVSWWSALDEMTGPEGAAFLDRFIKVLEADPSRFKSMNPENDWGDYDDFLETLKSMRDAVPTYNAPTTWHVSG